MLTPRRKILDAALFAATAIMALAFAGGVGLALLPAPAVQAPDPAASAAPQPLPAPLTEAGLKALWQGYDPPRSAETRQPAAPPSTATPKPGGEAAPESVPFKVRGIIFSRGGASGSVAFLEMDKVLSFHRVGGGPAGWRITDIEAGSVTFEREGKKRRLPIEQAAYVERAAEPAAVTPGAAQAQAQSSDRPAGIPPASRFAKPAGAVRGVPRSAPPSATYERGSAPPAAAPAGAQDVPADLIARLRTNPFEIIQQEGLQMVPHLENGVMSGVSLASVPSGSYAASFGFRPGDRIVAVNGQPLDSTARIVELYNKHLNARAVSVTVLRNGQRREMTFATK